MCTVCGCAGGGAKIDGGHAHEHTHVGPDGRPFSHSHPHDHAAGAEHDHPAAHAHGHDSLDYGAGPARAHAPGLSQTRMVQIETDILAKNDAYAAQNRARLAAAGVLALNLVSSPGSGKTTLLVRTIGMLAGRAPVAVIEGDQQTSADADRIRATGAPAVQINTGKGCHLDAHMVGHALERLSLEGFPILFIENVGNLVCPAAFDLGEAARVVIASVTEGEDKPLKYPDIFTSAHLAILSKTDLAPHCDADLDRYEANIRRVNPTAGVIRLSAKTGEGMEGWIAWLADRRRALLEAETAAAEARLNAARAAGRAL